MVHCPRFYFLWSLTSATLQMKCQAMFNIRYCFISTSYISLTEWKRNRKGSLTKQAFEIIKHKKNSFNIGFFFYLNNWNCQNIEFLWISWNRNVLLDLRFDHTYDDEGNWSKDAFKFYDGFQCIPLMICLFCVIKIVGFVW